METLEMHVDEPERSQQGQVVDSALSGLSDLSGADAISDLARALISTQTQLREDSLKEAIFIEMYAGEAGRRFVQRVLELKPHQAFAMRGSYMKAIQSIALQEFMRGVNLQLGGK